MMKHLKEKFQELYGSREARLFFAPGRVNIIGEHTDYNGGHVFPCALTLGIYGLARKREDDKLLLYSDNFKEAGVIESSILNLHYQKEDGWTNYVKGVIHCFQEKGYVLPSGFDLAICGDIPDGSGLSSSAALEVLTGTILKELYEFPVSPLEIAKLGQSAENEFCGMNCGIMDQFASAMGKEGHAIFLDTSTFTYEYAPLSLKDHKLVITNSKVKHSLVDSAYNARRRECERALKDLQKELPIQSLGDLSPEEFEAHKDLIQDPICQNRGKHAVYENQRTILAKEALTGDDLKKLGLLLSASHKSLRYDYEVSCEEIDYLVDLAMEIPGVLGSRITGGGFGGCTVSIVAKDSLDQFQTTLSKKYQEKYQILPEFYLVDCGPGAHEIK